MNRKEWVEKLKDAIVILQEPMVFRMLQKDRVYQREEEDSEACAREYQKIAKRLSKEEKEIIEKLLDARDRTNLDYSTLSFLAGMQSGFWLKELLSAEDSTNTKE